MSDPLSVVGTAVGITSLGIQVCQGLVSYLQSIEGRPRKIAEDLKEVQNLASVFYALKEILPKLEQRQWVPSKTVRLCLKESEEKLQEFQEVLIALRGSLDDRTKTWKFKDYGRSLIYPFREGSLGSLRRTLQTLLDNLSLAINTALL